MSERGKYQVFPDLRGERWESLKSSIARSGLLQDIIRDEDDNILDGHQRERACLETGTKPRYKVRRGLSEEKKWELVFALNEHRRHMTPEERLGVVVEMRRRGFQQERIAELLEVDQATISRDQAKAKRAGVDLPPTVTTTAGMKYPTERKSPGSKGKRKGASSAALKAGRVYAESPKGRLLLAGVHQLSPLVADGSVSLVATFAPNEMEFDGWDGPKGPALLAQVASRMLRADGWLAVSCYRPEVGFVISGLSEHLHVIEVLAAGHASGVWSPGGLTMDWNPVVLCSPQPPSAWVPELQDADDIGGSNWAHLIHSLTEPGETVIVPLMLPFPEELVTVIEMGRYLVAADPDEHILEPLVDPLGMIKA